MTLDAEPAPEGTEVYPRATTKKPSYRVRKIQEPLDDIAPGQLDVIPAWGEEPRGTGICLSGGGIRSASFCLGALQSFEEHGLLIGENHAKYLSAVSGGSYIATALTMVAQGPSKASTIQRMLQSFRRIREQSMSRTCDRSPMAAPKSST